MEDDDEDYDTGSTRSTVTFNEANLMEAGVLLDQRKEETSFTKIRAKLAKFVNSIWWQGPVFLLILLDVIVLIIQLYAFYGKSDGAKRLAQKFNEDSSLTNLTTAIVVILLVEVRS